MPSVGKESDGNQPTPVADDGVNSQVEVGDDHHNDGREGSKNKKHKSKPRNGVNLNHENHRKEDMLDLMDYNLQIEKLSVKVYDKAVFEDNNLTEYHLDNANRKMDQAWSTCIILQLAKVVQCDFANKAAQNHGYGNE
uniref:Uncharacterized protein n=1 Tax=Romanomermis culicivorax TaxID=13658 RepID=A0A915JA99_ROMCU